MKSLKDILLRSTFYILAVGIGLILFLEYHRRASKAVEKSKADFPSLKIEQPLAEKVIEIYCPPEVRCSTPPILVVLSDRKKMSINLVESFDPDVKLVYAISVGDSLVKGSNSDTLIVYKSDKPHRFLIR